MITTHAISKMRIGTRGLYTLAARDECSPAPQASTPPELISPAGPRTRERSARSRRDLPSALRASVRSLRERALLPRIQSIAPVLGLQHVAQAQPAQRREGD